MTIQEVKQLARIATLNANADGYIAEDVDQLVEAVFQLDDK